jgi:glycosyltransferase involved in cell wall biosynthesis
LLQWGGQSRRILLLAREHQRLGHRVTIAAPAASVLARRAAEAGLPVFGDATFPDSLAPGRIRREIALLAELIRREQFEIIDAHCTRDIWMSALAARRAGVPARVVRSRHNLFPVKPHLFNRYMHRRMVAWLIANCRAIAEIFVRGGLIPPERVSVIPSAVDLADCDLPHDPEAVRRELGIADEALVVAVAARISVEKGYRDLLEAAPTVLREHPRAVFLLLGTGPLEDEVRAAAKQRGLERAVVFAGFREDVCRVFSACDLVALPSHAEGTPASLLEAQALSRPVVATRVGGIPDIVREGETALLVEPGDPAALAAALSSLLADADRRRAMGEAGRALVEAEFTVERMAAKTLAAYQSALEAPA